MDDLVVRVESCGRELQKWNRDVYGNVNNNILKTQQKLEGLMFVSDFKMDAIKSCRKELNELLHMEEIMWKQRANEFYI